MQSCFGFTTHAISFPELSFVFRPQDSGNQIATHDDTKQFDYLVIMPFEFEDLWLTFVFGPGPGIKIAMILKRKSVMQEGIIDNQAMAWASTPMT